MTGFRSQLDTFDMMYFSLKPQSGNMIPAVKKDQSVYTANAPQYSQKIAFLTSLDLFHKSSFNQFKIKDCSDQIEA